MTVRQHVSERTANKTKMQHVRLRQETGEPLYGTEVDVACACSQQKTTCASEDRSTGVHPSTHQMHRPPGSHFTSERDTSVVCFQNLFSRHAVRT